ncbi:MAG: aromatic amino acid transport family protein [Bacteroidota bacterium]
MSVPKKPSIVAGIMITAGTAVGAGMFSLPIVSSGMWFLLSLICIGVIWFLNYLSALYVLEVNLDFPPGASFDTMVKKVLGPTWNLLSSLSIAFLLYILLYAYFSAFGNIGAHTLGLELSDDPWMQGLLSLGIGCILGAVVWFSSSLVGRISAVLVLSMVIAYIISMSGLSVGVEASKLFDIGGDHTSHFSYIWAALPYFMTAFGFTTVAPSLYKHYGKKVPTIKKGILYGSVLALLVYVVFLAISFGTIARTEFVAINKAGGNMGDLVNALQQQNGNALINSALNLFSNFAIITSFLGVGLGLFDYIADKFSFKNDRRGRFYAACITFLPPGIASFFFPDGFIAAIGFAGLVSIFAFFMITYFMVKKHRKNTISTDFQVRGGNALLTFFFLISVFIAICQILSMLQVLPKW